jgi:hypothetical protein
MNDERVKVTIDRVALGRAAHHVRYRGDPECPGAGKCHGCLKWCVNCGDVAHVCDARLRGDRCDEHPVPPQWTALRHARGEAERRAKEASRLKREVESLLAEVTDQERARRAYDAQRAEEERRAFEVK